MPNSEAIQTHPERIPLESLWVDVFPNRESFIARLIHEAQQPGLTHAYNVNINAANLAHYNPEFCRAMAKADIIFSDGAGISWGAQLLGYESFPRFTYFEWGPVALKAFADEGLKVFWLGSEPWIGPAYINYLDVNMPEHTVVGTFHGYLKNAPEAEEQAFKAINDCQPDILFVGMGMPLQEIWIERHRERLEAMNIKLILPQGAGMDYFAGKVSRCPQWIGDIGLEWLYRLGVEPRRLFKRYVVGNPQFMMRMLVQRFSKKS